MTFAMMGSERAPGILDRRPVVEPITSCNSAKTDFLRSVRAHMAACEPVDFHHVPGRLRLKADALKKNASKLDAVCDAFEALPGARSVTPNRLTGSILIDYDPSVLPPQDLSNLLQECRSSVGIGLPTWVERVGDKAIESLVEKLAVALIAAVV